MLLVNFISTLLPLVIVLVCSPVITKLYGPSFSDMKRVLIVDDVISTGESLASLEKILDYAQGKVAAKCAVLAEGGAADRTDIIFLEKLPLFPHN